MAQCCPDQGLQVNLEVLDHCGSVSGWLLGVRVCLMGIDSPFGWRCGSGGGIVLFELLDGHITQKFVDVGMKVDRPRRPSGGGSARRRCIERFPRGKGGDSRGAVEVGSMALIEFLCWWWLRRSNPGDRVGQDGQKTGHVGRQLLRLERAKI